MKWEKYVELIKIKERKKLSKTANFKIYKILFTEYNK